MLCNGLGIAVLRVDDRGAGKTTLGKNFTKLTSADFANDVETSMRYLQTRKDVATVGLIGHSEGGMIAPMVAARNSKVSFIILLAGPGQIGEAIWKYQMRRAFVKNNISKTNKQIADNLVNTMNDAFLHSSNYDTVVNEMKTTYTAWKENVNDSLQQAILKINGVADFIGLAKQYRSALAWLHYFLNYNPAINLKAVKCPILAINGESDIQVLCKENLSAIKKVLKKSDNKNYTIKSFPNLNHLFQTCTTKEQPYDEIEETFAPVALSYICDWIKETIK